MPSAGGDTGTGYERYRAVDIDFHRTLSDAGKSPSLGTPNPGMLELVQAILHEDPRNKIIISCGGIGDFGEPLKSAFRMWLRKHGVDTSKISFKDKPRSVAVVDDHALQYTGSNAQQLTSEILRRLRDLETKGPDVPMAGGRMSTNGHARLASRP